MKYDENQEISYPKVEPPRQKKFRIRFRGLPSDRPYLNITLFLLTIYSTYITGGLAYSVSIMTILLTHEMGHYLMCRRYGVPATLPFFIPFPFPQINPFGTMGALIQMKGYIPSRKALFDIGAAGPLAGFIPSVLTIYFGISHSTIFQVSQAHPIGIPLGESILFKSISYLAIGPVPDGYDVLLHPMAYAGWAGLFVTALNLLPIGQLDGGHIIYSLFPRNRTKQINLAFIGALGIMTIFYPGWGLLFVLLLLLGRRHPAPLDDITPLDTKRKILGIIAIIIFFTSFTPIPFKI